MFIAKGYVSRRNSQFGDIVHLLTEAYFPSYGRDFTRNLIYHKGIVLDTLK